MAKGVGVQVKGLKQLQQKLGRIPQYIAEEVDEKMAVAANSYVNLAVNDAPKDQGFVAGQITYDKTKVMDYKVVSGSELSAYLEFGTKSRVKVPSDLQAYAQQFKAKKSPGTAVKLYENILAWVKRKGIGGQMTSKGKVSRSQDSQAGMENAARAIWLSILRHGIHPHPFFFKHRKPVYKELKQSIQPAIRKALSK